MINSSALSLLYGFSSVQSLSCARLSVAPWTAACQASLSITNSQNLLKLKSIESVMQFNHLILCRPILLPPSIFPSIRVFCSELVLHIRRPKYWSFSFSISPCNEHPGLISFRMDWLDLLEVQGTLKSLLQLVCCDLWGRKESDMTERLNWTDTPCIFLFPWKQHQPKIFS